MDAVRVYIFIWRKSSPSWLMHCSFFMFTLCLSGGEISPWLLIDMATGILSISRRTMFCFHAGHADLCICTCGRDAKAWKRFSYLSSLPSQNQFSILKQRCLLLYYGIFLHETFTVCDSVCDVACRFKRLLHWFIQYCRMDQEFQHLVRDHPHQ